MVALLDELTAIRGTPLHLRPDNGREMISRTVKDWCAASVIDALYIDPGVTVAERDRGELQRPAARRATLVGDLRHAG